MIELSVMAGLAFAVFVAIALDSLALRLGIVGVWCGLLAVIGARLATCGWRFRGRRWAIVRAPRARA
jgi:Na+-driven multidrug efflux pump